MSFTREGDSTYGRPGKVLRAPAIGCPRARQQLLVPLKKPREINSLGLREIRSNPHDMSEPCPSAASIPASYRQIACVRVP